MKRLAILISATALTGTAAFAVVGVQDIDIDNDDFASFDELQLVAPGITQEDFDLIDDNNDGRISSQEMYDTDAQDILSRYDATMENLVDVDTDNDGFASYEEMVVVFEGLSREDFEVMDRNNDNRLSQFEIYDTDAQNILARYPFMESVADVQAIDTDGNNFLSRSELQASYPELTDVEFELMDLNNDNRVSYSELYEAEAQEIVSRYES